MSRMDPPTKVSMKGIGVSSKRSRQRPVMTEQVQKPKFGRQFRTQVRHSYRAGRGLCNRVGNERCSAFGKQMFMFGVLFGVRF